MAVIMKFGGTSVEDSTAIDRVAEIVCSRLGHDPVVVVSAMAKVTDQLGRRKSRFRPRRQGPRPRWFSVR